MRVSLADSAVKFVHLDYPNICICIVSGQTKQATLSIGIGQRKFPIADILTQEKYIEYFFGDDARTIVKVCQAMSVGEKCDEALIRRFTNA